MNALKNLRLDADPLDMPSGQIDTSFPKVVAGVYEMQIDKVDTKDNKANTGKNLVLTLKSLAPATTTTGETLNPGSFVLIHNVSLVPTEKYPPANIAKNIAAINQAAGMPDVTPRQIIDSPMLLQGKVLTVKVGIDKETAEFPEKNVVKQFVVKA